MAEGDSGTSTREFTRITLGSPSRNERDEVGGNEWGSEEEGKDDEDDVHRCELGNNPWTLEGFYSSMGGAVHRKM